MKEIIIDKKYEGKKLNTFLFGYFPNLSNNTLQKALRKKDIKLNDTRISTNIILHAGDNLKVFISDEFLYGTSESNLDIIYEDNNIIIVNKPFNIEVVGNNSLTSMLEKYVEGYVKPCHRIDRNTTGLVLFAKNESSLNILLDKFKKREIEKHYLATVYGILPKKSATLEAYLFKDNKKSLVYISDVSKKGYQKIITSYTVLSENKKDNFSVLDVKLETGRTHQIRAHLAHIGFPIIGDGKYGVNEINKAFNKKYQMLCSYKLKFCFNDSSSLDYLNGKEFELK